MVMPLSASEKITSPRRFSLGNPTIVFEKSASALGNRFAIFRAIPPPHLIALSLTSWQMIIAPPLRGSRTFPWMIRIGRRSSFDLSNLTNPATRG